MSQRIDAIFVNGVFQPQAPVDFADGQRVSLDVTPRLTPSDDLQDLRDLLDHEFVVSCREYAASPLARQHVSHIPDTFQGSLAEMISQERDER